jgi:hypothetical protein
MAIPLRLMIPSSLVLLSAWDSSKNVNLFTSVQVLFLEGLSLGLAVVLLALFRESLGFGQISFFQFTVCDPFSPGKPFENFSISWFYSHPGRNSHGVVPLGV